MQHLPDISNIDVSMCNINKEIIDSVCLSPPTRARVHKKYVFTYDDISLDIVEQSNESLSPNIPDNIMSDFMEDITSQDATQLRNVALKLLLELYRVLMGTFLIVFVPQECVVQNTSQLCTFSENIRRSGIFETSTLFMNVLSLFCFLILYAIEYRREHKMICYLHVSKSKPQDNESVKQELVALSQTRRTTLLKLDHDYATIGKYVLCAFTLNTGMSAVVIFNNYIDTSTISVFLTNVLFMGMKMYDIYYIMKTDENIFYSAYLSEKLQYNDVDPDKIEVEASADMNQA
jgi:hypothetical protein